MQRPPRVLRMDQRNRKQGSPKVKGGSLGPVTLRASSDEQKSIDGCMTSWLDPSTKLSFPFHLAYLRARNEHSIPEFLAVEFQEGGMCGGG